MKIFRFVISLAIVGLLILPTMATAKVGIRLQQTVSLISTQDRAGNLHTANAETYAINNQEIKQKAGAYVGQQARILYFTMAQNKICVDIAAATDAPFVISTPEPSPRKPQ